ncbi:MAG: type II toxin-antitoxin system RelE/ParE family toxin [Myxococcales bacterium]|nr:type II toxin-antitoxin system RelE/ParE family toxin [Myxococcales bacterium]
MILIHPPRLKVFFFRTSAGTEPVREWLQSHTTEDKKLLGEAIKTVQFGWPIGMPVVRPLHDGLFEVRIGLLNREARVLFVAVGGQMVLLHAFIKKSQQTPPAELALARARAAEFKRGVAS